MKRIGIFYGSTSGNTEKAARLIQAECGADDVTLYSVAKSIPQDMLSFDILILGTSTWGYGDMQDDWADFAIDGIDFTGRTVALFGLGDQESYTDTFVDGMGILYSRIVDHGGHINGQVPKDGYTNSGSLAIVDDMFVGLPLDEDNQADRTEERIRNWVKMLKEQW